MRQTVTAVIPTKNVEKIIRGTLESLKFCDEVILVDMHSTDKTHAIAAEYPNVRVIERESYIFANFNHGVQQSQSDWIIRMDSDERLSPELQQEVVDVLEKNPPVDVYTAPYYSYFLGKAMMYGDKFARREVLFRKGSLAYPEKSEHEALEAVDNKKLSYGELQHQYIHFSCPSIKKYMDKINYYSEKDIERAKDEELVILSPFKALALSFRYFMRYYFKKRGYKDGYHGFAMCALDAFYFLLNYLKYWERKERLKDYHDKVRDDYDDMLKVKSLKNQV